MESTSDIWLQRAQSAYSASTTYFDTNIRSQVERDLRQIQGLHPSGSKYNSDAYKARSKLFRPKTRSVLRQNEATAAGAFFSTQDVVAVRPDDDNDPFQAASAEINQALLQYRLTKTIPWFQLCIGAYQSAMSVGVACSYQYWEYDPKRGIDRPCIELLPIENVRIAPSADWTDPVGSSPYVIRLVPMYVKDVLHRMNTVDDKTNQPKWKKLSMGEIRSAIKQDEDSIRQTREGARTDSTENNSDISEFDVVWVHENIMNIDGEDMVFFTLGTEHRLSEPKPLKEVYFHGERPIVMGVAILEAHKVYPASVPSITKDVQAEINEVANLRLDNVKFVLNKRYFVKRNRQVDLRSLTRNVPGSATLLTDVDDVKVVDTSDVTSSSFREQDRLNLDFDDVAGTFSNSSVQSNRALNETVGGMDILTTNANQVAEYQLRTFTETWVEPVLRQLIKLEQAYETDEKILALAGQSAELYPRYGIDAVTDDLLMQELIVSVNVGIGATNPQAQVEKFIMGMRSLRELLGDNIIQQVDTEEVIKELFGKLGYKDGLRFFTIDGDMDPQVAQLYSIIEDLQMQLASKRPDPELLAAQIEKLQAETAKINADTLQTGVEANYAAMQAAETVAAIPEIAPVADAILEGANWSPPVLPGNDPMTEEPGLISELSAALAGMEGQSEPYTPSGGENTSPMFPPLPEDAATPYDGIETQEAG